MVKKAVKTKKKKSSKVAVARTNEKELIGFHKGALSVLVKEREEMTRILTIVEQLMQAHIAELNKLGVDLQAEAQQIKKTKTKQSTRKKPIDELL